MLMDNCIRNSAWLYDLDSRDNLRDDLPFYLEFAMKYPGEILELGCGTGRVALFLASKGIDVTGIDLSEQMLDVFKNKLGNVDNNSNMGKINLIHGNMKDFSLDKKFSMIVAPFRAFQAITDSNDVLNSLMCIRKHLDDEGIFIVNVFNPSPIMDESWIYPEKTQWKRVDEQTGNYVVKKHWGDKIDTVNQIIYPHFAFEVTYTNGKTERIVDDLPMKYYYSNQLRKVILDSGMSIIDEYSWYDKSPLDGREIIFVCKRDGNAKFQE